MTTLYELKDFLNFSRKEKLAELKEFEKEKV